MMQQVCINAMKPYNVTQKIQQKLAVARPISLLPSSHQTVPPRAIITHLKRPQNSSHVIGTIWQLTDISLSLSSCFVVFFCATYFSVSSTDSRWLPFSKTVSNWSTKLPDSSKHQRCPAN